MLIARYSVLKHLQLVLYLDKFNYNGTCKGVGSCTFPQKKLSKMYLSLDQIKKHLNIDNGFVDDDNYLIDLASVAENAVEKHIDTKLKDLEDKEGNLPSPLLHSMLLMIGSLYAKRESISFSSVQEVPLAYDYLLSLFKNYHGNKE